LKYAKKNRMMTSAAVLAIVATAAVACSSSPDGSTTGTSTTPPGKGGSTSSGDASQITSLIRTGITQASQRNWTAATNTFDEVLAMEPNNVYANYNLGVIEQSTGNSAGALSDYNKALAADTLYTPAMYNEAILLESTQPLDAIAMYQKIVRIDPQASTAYLRMAVVQAEQGDATAAKADDAKAVAIDPSLAKYKLPAKQ
jgi:tetratricopeptide (TPR) repeat protein